MKSCEDLVAPVSDYFIYSPSRMAQETFLYPLQCGLLRSVFLSAGIFSHQRIL